MKPWLKHRNVKRVCINILLELLLTDKEEFWCYLRINTISCEISNIAKFRAGYIICMVLVCFKEMLRVYLILRFFIITF